MIQEIKRICREIRDIEQGLFAEDGNSSQALALAEIRLLLMRIARRIPVTGTEFLLAVMALAGRRHKT